ncbi:MAG: hypothetical protein SGBAC_003250 [Bacillariaceae sp.]
MPNKITTLLLVDVQKDFHPGGSLAIPTADDDAGRIAQLIETHSSSITRIVATMDSHLKLHIAHPGFWLAQDGKTQPTPFTLISSEDIVNGKWKPRSNLNLDLGEDQMDGSVFGGLDNVVDEKGRIDLLKYSIEYTKRLEEKGKFKLCIWPEHCLVGKEGHCIVDPIMKAIDEWSMSTGGSVEYVLKGQNLITESYSALEAEVPVTKGTSFNESLQKRLEESDHLLVCGQAMSHCVNYTLRSIVTRWPKEKYGNITLLSDCASSVPGFEEAGETFQKDMRAIGVNVKKAAEAL